MSGSGGVKAIFECDVEGNSLTIWDAGIGHKVIFSSETFAVQQAELLLKHERMFHAAKEATGIAAISVYGEYLSPYEYLQRAFKAWRSKVGQSLGIEVFENVKRREEGDYW